MKTIEDLLRDHPFFKGLNKEHVAFIAGCGTNVVFKKGEYVCRDGKPADYFYIIREGKVAIDVLTAGQGPVIVQTVQKGEVLGWSWIIEPYYWRFDARAMETTHAVALDGKCLRAKCEKDTKLGYQLLKRFSSVLAQRLEMTRLQLMDIYGRKPEKANA
ncbi:MAG: Crp/Fnr family transcriptional regulator [Omnitrophica WOR_2 bacterium RIFCSPHIGHO2_02_FULL_52_10]|nr:MAG: Crp/Fnr family transcriptional regulator [Omnitrophica WOR_2 bacterium RIFCSPHIGHO2_02_FULL_52_10]